MLTSIVPCKGLRIPESRKILLMESGIQLKESGIHLTIGIQDPTDKHWNRVSGIRNTAQRILNPTKDWNPESYRQTLEKSTWNLEYNSRNPESY